MSSHREAPEISKDPVADSTDVYAFVSPDRPDSVTLISNYIPLEDPAGGPNFFEFGDDVLYRILVDNDGDGEADVTYEFRFRHGRRESRHVPVQHRTDPQHRQSAWNRKQFYSVTRITKGKKGRRKSEVLGKEPAVPAVQHRATVDAELRRARRRGDQRSAAAASGCSPASDSTGSTSTSARSSTSARCARSRTCTCINMPGAAEGVDALRSFNVHTHRDPGSDLAADARRRDTDRSDVANRGDRRLGLGVAAARHVSATTTSTLISPARSCRCRGSATRCSTRSSFRWATRTGGTRLSPDQDAQFAQYVAQPELAKLLPVLYPGVFPNLAAYTADRADLLAILLTGIPAGIIPGFQNFTGTTQADLLRLNVAIPPAASQNILGILGGDLAGFPNGRRVQDDITTIELRAIAGATIPLVDPSFTADGAAALISDGTGGPAVLDGTQPPTNVSYLDTFPYLDHPKSGYDTVPLNVGAP